MTGFLESLLRFLLNVYEWLICWDVLYDFQRGVIVRLGKYHRPARAGWNWRLPLGIEEVLACNVVPTTSDLPPQAVVTKDGETALVECVILWRITSPRKFILEVEDTITVLSEAGAGTVHDVMSNYTWGELQTSDVEEELTETVRDRARQWGIGVMHVQITSLSRLGLRHGSLRLSEPTAMG